MPTNSSIAVRIFRSVASADETGFEKLVQALKLRHWRDPPFLLNLDTNTNKIQQRALVDLLESLLKGDERLRARARRLFEVMPKRSNIVRGLLQSAIIPKAWKFELLELYCAHMGMHRVTTLRCALCALRFEMLRLLLQTVRQKHGRRLRRLWEVLKANRPTILEEMMDLARACTRDEINAIMCIADTKVATALKPLLQVAPRKKVGQRTCPAPWPHHV